MARAAACPPDRVAALVGVLRAALVACLWNIANDLDLEFEQLYDLGV